MAGPAARDDPAGPRHSHDLAAAVALRLAGYAEIERVRLRELRDLSDEQGAAIADDLLQSLAFLPDEADRGSGLIEQQRWFSLIRDRERERKER